MLRTKYSKITEKNTLDSLNLCVYASILCTQISKKLSMEVIDGKGGHPLDHFWSIGCWSNGYRSFGFRSNGTYLEKVAELDALVFWPTCKNANLVFTNVS